MRRAKDMTVEMVPIGKILPNRYRHGIGISEEKVQALLQSYENSGFWDGSIQARPHPTKKDHVEIAFGHHRVEAARRANIPELGLVVAERSNDDMMRMMADENRGEFKHDAMVNVETVAAVIEAYGRGEIHLPPVPTDGRQDGVHFTPTGVKYSLQTVAKYLRWQKKHGDVLQANRACADAFDAYQQREFTGPALEDIPAEKRSGLAVMTVTDASKAAGRVAEKAGLPPGKVAEARKLAAKDAAEKVNEVTGRKARHEAMDIGRAAVRKVAPKAKVVPPVELYMARIIAKCQVFSAYTEIKTECLRLTPYVNDLDPAMAKKLADALQEMMERNARGIQYLVDAFKSGNRARIAAQLGNGK